MKKSLLILAVCLLVIFIFGCQKKEAPVETEEAAVAPMAPAVEISLIEKVAKIAAMFEVDPIKGADLMKEAELTQEEYKKVMADIALDEESTKLFMEKKAEYKAEFESEDSAE